MTSIVQIVIDGYYNIDPGTKNFPLIESPYPLIIIISSYLYFCLKCGPRFMEGRKAYELKNTILVYNFVQILLSCYLAYHGSVLWYDYNWFCQPIDYVQDTPSSRKMLWLCWLYFFAKLTELLDTVFFVLRKKFKQISFLHLFHHTVMPLFSYIGVRYVAGGHGTLLGLINSYVHIVMYTYYLIAGLGPHYQKYLWWKKYVTLLQLVQFGIVFLHNLFPLFSSCTYPKMLHVLILIFASFFFYMFASFYINTYVKNPKKEDSIKKKAKGS